MLQNEKCVGCLDGMRLKWLKWSLFGMHYVRSCKWMVSMFYCPFNMFKWPGWNQSIQNRLLNSLSSLSNWSLLSPTLFWRSPWTNKSPLRLRIDLTPGFVPFKWGWMRVIRGLKELQVGIFPFRNETQMFWGWCDVLFGRRGTLVGMEIREWACVSRIKMEDGIPYPKNNEKSAMSPMELPRNLT
jgi:hypothetical protein